MVRSSLSPMQVKEEFLELLKILESYKPKVILEIGSYKGGTLFCFAKLAPENSLIISIDLPFWGNEKFFKYDNLIIKLFNNFVREDQEIHLIRGYSQSIETINLIEKVLKGRKIDFLFIDGDHSYEAVKSNFVNYLKFLNDNAIVAFHDIALMSGSYVFWKEIKDNQKKYGYKAYKEIVKNGLKNLEGCGIGILYF